MKLSEKVPKLLLSKPWSIALFISLVSSTVLIERRYGLFTTTFLSNAILEPALIPVFFLASAIIDLAFIQTLLVVWMVSKRVFRLSYRTFNLSFIALSSSIIIGLNVLEYNIVSFLGDIVRIDAAINLGGGLTGTFPYLMELLPTIILPLLLIVLLGMSAFAVLWFITRRVPNLEFVSLRRQFRFLAILFPLLICVEFGMLAISPGHPLSINLRRTTLHPIACLPLSVLTDFDGDHFGLFGRWQDFSPFDPSRHPFAIEIPGNGIDENGVGGDLPRYVPPETEPLVDAVVSRPDIVLVVSCSLRYDVVFGGSLGPSVMPALFELAESNFSCDRAYSHSGFTSSSLQAILCGRITRHRRSLIQDMKAAGYRVGVFSVGSTEFGDTRAICALEEADKFFDASMAVDSKVTTYSVPSSIIISSERMIAECEDFLETSDPNLPVFLCVFFETTHFPYAHDSPRLIVPHTRLPRAEMVPRNRKQLIGMYRNAAANLDIQIAEIMGLVRRLRKDPKPVFIITADHGESLFDDGMLGHGLIIDDVQTRVPLIIANGWGSIPSPFGHSDVRPFILKMLSLERPENPLVTVRTASKPVFQYIGVLGEPLQIGVVSDEGRNIFDFDRRKFTHFDVAGSSVSKQDEANDSIDLIHRWETFCVDPDSLPATDVKE